MTPVQLNLLELCKETISDQVQDDPAIPIRILLELIDYGDELVTDLYYSWAIEEGYIENE